MAATISYGNLWNRSNNTVGESLPEDEARRRHADRERYCAVLEEDGRPVVALDINFRPPVVDVFFLDEQARAAGQYTFVAHPDGDGLWLEQTRQRRFVGPREMVAQDSTWTRPDGRLRNEVRAKNNPTVDVTEGRFDPAEHPELREPMPEFGDYDSIARWERT
ncbi:hypothetical protein [Jiangella asiatica]|uniref:Uncharacterized protein n=1 Tax=Jiangella asiatica TaxID=2530372 RepID=A0A4R5D986_9ACTN|nr:hypothetical protein [Jiangella asiatica]TDE10152.1 hypothetical protein E1269_12615 [Jiangella asiatica]